eukprot:PhF_6_TR6933/c0_g1_i2/m.10150
MRYTSDMLPDSIFRNGFLLSFTSPALQRRSLSTKSKSSHTTTNGKTNAPGSFCSGTTQRRCSPKSRYLSVGVRIPLMEVKWSTRQVCTCPGVILRSYHVHHATLWSTGVGRTTCGMSSPMVQCWRHTPRVIYVSAPCIAVGASSRRKTRRHTMRTNSLVRRGMWSMC